MDGKNQGHDDEAYEKYYPTSLRTLEIEMIRQRRAKACPVSADCAKAGDSPGSPGALPGDTVGLALSGGGIRSATFCLGFLQVLAGHDLLRRVDLLSTVSGGGYCGAFLGRWFQRGGPGTVVPPKEGETGASADDGRLRPLDRMLRDHASAPLRWLREGGRYMSPTGPGDAWLVFATYLRNAVTLQLVLAVAFLGLFLVAGVLRGPLEYRLGYSGAQALAASPFFPDAGDSIWWSPWLLLPLVLLGIVTLPLGWAYWLVPYGRGRGTGGHWALGTTSFVILGCAVGVARAGDIAGWLGMPAGTNGDFARALSTALGILGGLAALALVWLALVCLALVRFRPGGLHLKGGVAALKNRLSAMLSVFLGITGMALAFALVDSLGQTVYALGSCQGWAATLLNWKALPCVSGAIAIVAGIRKISTLFDRAPGEKRWKLPVNLVLAVAAILVAAVLLTAIATAANAIVWLGQAPVDDPGKLIVQYEEHPNVSLDTASLVKVGTGTLHPKHATASGRVPGIPLAVAAVAILLSFFIGRVLGFVNLSSQHALYAARLTRAYLGGSNPARVPELKDLVEKPPGPVQEEPPALKSMREVHPDDDIAFDEYRPHVKGGPLHILNVTINETVRGDSQIEYRDRKGLPMAVGPAGVSIGARHHARWANNQGDDSPARQEESRGDKKRKDARGLAPINAVPGKFHPLAPAPGRGHAQAEARTLGEWVAISGAAFTTGLGYRTNLGASLLLGMSNIRLGYWWDCAINPSARRIPGEWMANHSLGSFMTRVFPVQTYLLSELLARFHGTNRRRWYLSDGGHFENTACYDLIRRRVPRIICCDCGADPKYLWEDVANLARKVRIDFNAEMTFLRPEDTSPCWVPAGLIDKVDAPENIGKSTEPATGPAPKGRGHGTLARVYYLDVPEQREAFYRKRAPWGSEILFVKPSLSGSEPQDLLEYARTHETFPQESTLDQDFDEAQWESYRKLGEHIGGTLLPDFKSDPWWKGTRAKCPRPPL